MLVGKDGSRYEGQFKRGKRDGQGRLLLQSGKKYEGLFKDDKFIESK